MDWLDNIFLGILGAAAGFTVSGGVFTALLAVGLIPRFAGKTHTGRHILLYEEMVVCGSIFGAIISVFFPFIRIFEWVNVNAVLQKIHSFAAPVFLGIYGLFAGIFVGCLALAIAEMLDTIPIFARRTKFRHGVGIAVLCMAIGKTMGSLIYFMKEMF